MTISLNSATPALSLELEVQGEIVQALASALERSDRLHGVDDYRRRLAAAISEAVAKTLPWELQPPSAAQLSFAASISRRLKVEIPREAALFRGVMHEFISDHADQMEGDGYVSRKKKPEVAGEPNTKPESAIARALRLHRNRSR